MARSYRTSYRSRYRRGYRKYRRSGYRQRRSYRPRAARGIGGVSLTTLKRYIRREVKRPEERERKLARFRETHERLFHTGTGKFQWFTNSKAYDVMNQPESPWVLALDHIAEDDDGEIVDEEMGTGNFGEPAPMVSNKRQRVDGSEV